MSEWVLLAIRLFHWPFNPSLALLVSALVFRSFDHKSMILGASNLGLPCFTFPLVG